MLYNHETFGFVMGDLDGRPQYAFYRDYEVLDDLKREIELVTLVAIPPRPSKLTWTSRPKYAVVRERFGLDYQEGLVAQMIAVSSKYFSGTDAVIRLPTTRDPTEEGWGSIDQVLSKHRNTSDPATWAIRTVQQIYKVRCARQHRLRETDVKTIIDLIQSKAVET